MDFSFDALFALFASAGNMSTDTLAAALIALVALVAMEIVLGIDNIIFIAILVDRLPEEKRAFARNLGLIAAMVMRIALLGMLWLIMEAENTVFALTDFMPWFTWLEGHEKVDLVTWKDIIMLLGGLFLVGKSVHEIHAKLEDEGQHHEATAKASLFAVLTQIALFDIIFSLDSVITAVGMAEQLWVMVVAIIIAVGVMMIFAGAVSRFVEQHPTLKMLALSFLILIGVMLIAEGIGTHIEKGYIYFAMAFALGVEVLNLRIRKRTKAKAAAAAESA
jgi:predicted tellurium resistance membrane protein TerC